jgi:energy-coupling factor transporter ATP-binding protein EcfA2
MNASHCSIEFLGLPGSGKSTLCNALLQLLKNEQSVLSHQAALHVCLRDRTTGGLPGKVVKQLPVSFWHPLIGMNCTLSEVHHFGVTHTGLMRYVFELMQYDMKTEWRSCVLHVFLQLAAEHVLFEKYLASDQSVFIEEGFIQAALSAFGYLPLNMLQSQTDINRYLDHCPLPSDVIWLDTLPNLCMQRLKKRPALPLILSDTDCAERLAHMHACIQQLVQCLEERNVRVWRILNEEGRSATSAVSHARAWALTKGFHVGEEI